MSSSLLLLLSFPHSRVHIRYAVGGDKDDWAAAQAQVDGGGGDKLMSIRNPASTKRKASDEREKKDSKKKGKEGRGREGKEGKKSKRS